METNRGNENSSARGDGQDEGLPGYHLTGVQPNSHAAGLGLEPFFDVLLGVGDLRLNANLSLAEWEALLNKPQDPANEERLMTMEIYNVRDRDIRRVSLPFLQSEPGRTQEKLGLSARFCNADAIGRFIWHVTSLQPNSPGQEAGLLPNSDYIFSATDTAFDGPNAFYEYIGASKDKAIGLVVYNTDTGAFRVVQLRPREGWGGQGL